MMPNCSFVIILIFLHYITSNPARCSSNETTDVLALLSFKHDLIDQRGALNSWTANPTQLNYHCSWKGITCGTKHPSRVVSINLRSKGLVGTLSPHLGNLSFLRHIILQNNSFQGPIPQELGHLRRLVYLEMSNNSFSGEIPRNLSQCRNLNYLNLIDNELTGIIPPDLASLSKLKSLGLSDNTFSGTIPPFLGNLTSLTQLALGNCGFRGEIPDSLVRLQELQRLVLYMNELTGTIPSGLFNISTIKYFIASFNKLQGTIPSDIGLTLPNLIYLGFGGNNLTGALPVSLSNASFLQVIDLYSNRFTGPVPTNLDRLTHLQIFSIYSNYVQDDISFLSSLTNCTDLIFLHVDDNSLTGSLPLAVSNLTQLTILSIGVNQIHGTIPSSIGNLVGLQILHLGPNRLSGPIPETIGKLTKLEKIYLRGNRFVGELPSSIGNLTLLSLLYSGSNYFSGSIPPSLANCSSLLAMDLSVNNFSGPIPREIMTLSSLSIFLDMSNNALFGSVPSEIGSLTNLAVIDLSYNRLSGIFPSTISSCISLQQLYVGNNSFYGEIPQGLRSLKALQVLDLATNNFSGPIPSFLGRINLTVLNLSSNKLEGPVPIDGVFLNKSAFSVQGNPGLCGGIQELDLRPCPASTPNNPKKKKSSSLVFKVLIPTAAFVVIFVIALVVCCYMLVRRRANSRKNINESSLESQFRRLSYADLLRATGGFSEANLIGSGRFSNVYKGILDEGETLIAVKLLKLDVRGAHKSFVSECNALRGARHRNLLKILSISVSTDFQQNDFMALIYPLMPKGSLDKWLHSDQTRYITLMQRINIAIDIASAVEYLHNGTGSVIVHGDLKPCNVLLDDDMSAHVGDFGLAKVISNISSSFAADESSSIVVKGTIGYIAPEYGMGGAISTEGDVYSYGILLLEMLTNIRPTSERLMHSNLRDYVVNGLPDRLMEILDPVIVEQEGVRLSSGVAECVGSVFEIGMACSRKVPHDRMTMTDVVIQLKRTRVACNAQGFN